MDLEQEDSYILNFVDRDGNVIDKISAPLGVNLPTDNEFSTIIANLKGGDDNWGGQFDAINKTIGLDTPYSGKYIITTEQGLALADGLSGKSKKIDPSLLGWKKITKFKKVLNKININTTIEEKRNGNNEKCK